MTQTTRQIKRYSNHIFMAKTTRKATFINWEYAVLSQVRTLEGLYLFEKKCLQPFICAARRTQSIRKKSRKNESKPDQEERERAIKEVIG